MTDSISYTDPLGVTRFFSRNPLFNPPQFLGGVYVFAYWNGNLWVPLYVGKTCDFGSRFDEHHKQFAAAALGATDVLVHYEHDEIRRSCLEATMIAHLKPVLNERQPRPLEQFWT